MTGLSDHGERASGVVGDVLVFTHHCPTLPASDGEEQNLFHCGIFYTEDERAGVRWDGGIVQQHRTYQRHTFDILVPHLARNINSILISCLDMSFKKKFCT